MSIKIEGNNYKLTMTAAMDGNVTLLQHLHTWRAFRYGFAGLFYLPVSSNWDYVLNHQ